MSFVERRTRFRNPRTAQRSYTISKNLYRIRLTVHSDPVGAVS